LYYFFLWFDFFVSLSTINKMNEQKPYIIDGHQDIAFNSIHCTGKDFMKRNRFDQSTLLPEPQLNQSDYVRLMESGVKVVQGVIFPYHFEADHSIVGSEEIGFMETNRQLDFYLELEKRSEGKVRILKNASDLEYVFAHQDVIGIIILIEDAIGVRHDLSNLQELYDRGVRIIGPVWNRDNQFAGGTDTDMGFTEAGKKLLSEMEKIGFALDTAHMNVSDFMESVPNFGGVVINSHTCCSALNAHRRNLTDEQLLMLAQKDGVVGVAFVTKFLKEKAEEATILDVKNHIDHMVSVMGIEHVAFGSDFDGVSWPNYIEKLPDVSKLSELRSLVGQTYSVSDTSKVSYENWLRVLKRILK